MTDTGSVGSWSDVGSLDRKSHFSIERDEDEEAFHQEHLRLAGIVKGVHADLRRKYKKSTGGTDLEKIWYDHCQNKQILSQYADAMHHLAIDHWSKNNHETRIDWCRDAVLEYFKHDGLKKVLEKEKRRKERQTKQTSTGNPENGNPDVVNPDIVNADIVNPGEMNPDIVNPGLKNAEPVLEDCDNENVSQDLNNAGEMQTVEQVLENKVANPETVLNVESNLYPEKVDAVHERLGDKNSCSEDEACTSCQDGEVNIGASKLFIKRQYNMVDVPVQCRIRLLDVGSCFNPFLAFPDFQSIGIDISPAAETVYHCDFLHLRTTDPLQVANDTMTTFINNLKDPVEWLPRECFHVVIFSLLLEYFPAPYQRWVSCQKAHELLMYNGILVIVTPDSSHQNRNAGMMKSWKIAIESLGFKRWRYVKLEHLHCMVFRKVNVTEEEKRESFLRGITADMLYIPQDFHDIPDESSAISDVHSYSYEDEQFYKNYTLHELPVLLSESDENDE